MAVFTAVTSASGIAPATGIPPHGITRFDNLTVYQLAAGIATSQGVQQVFNPFAVATPPNQLIEVTPDDSGNYYVSYCPGAAMGFGGH